MLSSYKLANGVVEKSGFYYRSLRLVHYIQNTARSAPTHGSNKYHTYTSVQPSVGLASILVTEIYLMSSPSHPSSK